MKLFGLVGTAGSGKDTVAEMMVDMYGMHQFNTGDFTRAVTRFIYDIPQDTNPVRDQLFETATVLRELNPTTTVRMGILQAEQRGFDIQIITGLRTIGEAQAIRDAGGTIIAVDADPELRHARIQSRLRDTEAQRTFEEFKKQDDHENEGVADGPMKGIKYVVADAEIVIENNGTLEDLEAQIKAKMANFS